MQDMQKPEGGDIRLDEKSAFLRWLDNFWYHHKWHTFFGAFILLLLLVMLMQCRNENGNDLVVTYCGPFGFLTAESEGARDALNEAMPQDYDGNGEKYVEFVRYQVYSEEEMIADKEANDGEGTVNVSYNAHQLELFNDFMMTGECSIYLLSPYIYDYIQPRGNLKKLAEVMDAVPEHAYDEYAIRLSETALYQNTPALQLLSPDTLVCLTVPYALGRSSNESYYAQSVETFLAIVSAE
ncbi:MAG: hypothetical protein J6R04_01655 [Clostridia bacterium]|nr:hypothetical protein [Clostridia bacterium]